jgi:hypothetical protein
VGRAAKQTPGRYGDIVAATIDFITESGVGWFHGGAMRSDHSEFIAARSSIDGLGGMIVAARRTSTRRGSVQCDDRALEGDGWPIKSIARVVTLCGSSRRSSA